MHLADTYDDGPCLDTAREQLRKRGFAAIEAVFTNPELHDVEAILDRLMLQTDPAFRRRRRELSADRRASVLRQPEFLRPTAAAPGLRELAVYTKCQRVAETLLGQRAHYLFDHAIYKMPRSGAATPWHQDQAYLGKSGRIQSVHFWIPLQDTDATSGCLRFVPRSHEAQLQPHVSAYADNPHVLRTCTDYSGLAIDVPLRKGDVSIHTNLTIHSSGPNESQAVRKAWIIHFGDKSIWYKRIMQLKDLATAAASVHRPAKS